MFRGRGNKSERHPASKSGRKKGGGKKGKKNRNGGEGQKGKKPMVIKKAAPAPKPALSKVEAAEAMLKKMPNPPPLMDLLKSIVYEKGFTQANKDVLRLIRRVQILKRLPGEAAEEIHLSAVEIPEGLVEHSQSVYLFMVFMKELVDYFEPERAEQLKAGMDDIFQKHLAEEGSFTVMDLLTVTGGENTKCGYAVKCLSQSVAISGHTHIKTKICPLHTKDYPGEEGWRIYVTLAEFVQVKHTRREISGEPASEVKNRWEIEFDVSLTFARNMKEITAATLAITDLVLSEIMESELADYLKEKFQNGKLVLS